MKARITKARRVVVKIGSALLVDGDSGALHRKWLDALDDDAIAAKRTRLAAACGADVLVLSGVSGAGVAEVLRALFAIAAAPEAAEAAS